MACRGGLVALTAEQREALLSAENDDAKIDLIQEFINVDDTENNVETDKAWEGIHRALARMDPKSDELPPGSSDDPLAQVILGGKPVLEDESGYIVRMIEPHQIQAIAAALRPIDEAAFKVLYDTYCKGAQPYFDDDDLEYTWEWLRRVKGFFEQVAQRPRTVVFSVDQ